MQGPSASKVKMNVREGETRDLFLEFVWIPPELGGHAGPPFEGMRLSIRWQALLKDYLDRVRDIECNAIEFDVVTSRGTMTGALTTPLPSTSEMLRDGALVELLSGHRVLAVGRVRSPKA